MSEEMRAREAPAAGRAEKDGPGRGPGGWWRRRRSAGKRCERTSPVGFLQDRGPTRTTFLPWLFMGLGALSHLIQGRGNPWLGGLALLAFNSLYVTVVFVSFDVRRRDSRTPVYALALLTVVTYAVALGFGSNWLLFFPLLSLASGTVRRLQGRPFMIWLMVIAGSAGAITGSRQGAWEAVGIGYGTFISGAVTAAILRLFDTIRELESTRQELARTAVEKERLRFSRDLHDLLGHTLSVVVVKAEAVRRLAPTRLTEALAQAADIEAVGRQALTEIREAVSGYREGGLSIELDRATSALEAAGIAPEVRRSGPPMPPQTEALLGWVVREAVTNTVRHSGAARCEIEVRVSEDLARLSVTDDGDGPVSSSGGAGDPSGGAGARQPVGGTGLKGLTERLAAAGGSLVTGADGRRGFRLVAELPVDAVADSDAGRATGVGAGAADDGQGGPDDGRVAR
ncbi:sensor histidine kinase [Streptomyces sp. NPDC059740]|uniref:sensor histidine kinase n=1 Tax=Streptomyces sp. NPDC059740 TaxID=3346926 RepID=UPI003646139A